MILEGIVTSLDSVGQVNVAPMGPIVDPAMSTLLLRPFRTSTTYQNLKQQRSGVFHVVDDVLLLTQAAIGQLTEIPATFPAEMVPGAVLESACRWYEFEVDEIDDTEDRTRLRARVVHMGRLRDFFGFNRAKHAVLEGAILATRLGILPLAEIEREFEALRTPVEKTAGPQELQAFALLQDYLDEFRNRTAKNRIAANHSGEQ